MIIFLTGQKFALMEESYFELHFKKFSRGSGRQERRADSLVRIDSSSSRRNKTSFNTKNLIRNTYSSSHGLCLQLQCLNMNTLKKLCWSANSKTSYMYTYCIVIWSCCLNPTSDVWKNLLLMQIPMLINTNI